VKLDSGLVLLGFVVWSLFFGLVMFYQGYGRGVVDENPQYPREPPRCQIIQTIVNNRGPCSCPSWESCGYSDWDEGMRFWAMAKNFSESMECEPVNLDLQLCVSGGECNSGVCIDGVCYDGSG